MIDIKNSCALNRNKQLFTISKELKTNKKEELS